MAASSSGSSSTTRIVLTPFILFSIGTSRTSGVARIATLGFPIVPDVLGMLELQAGRGEFGQFLAGTLGQNRMAGVAFLGDPLAGVADVLAVMAAEAAGRDPVADVVGVFVPADLHLGEEIGAVDGLDLLDGGVEPGSPGYFARRARSIAARASASVLYSAASSLAAKALIEGMALSIRPADSAMSSASLGRRNRWLGRLWQSMQSMRRLVMRGGLRVGDPELLVLGAVDRHLAVWSVTRTQGMTRRLRSVAMYSTVLTPSMCQWMPRIGPWAGSPPPMLRSILMVQGEFFSSVP